MILTPYSCEKSISRKHLVSHLNISVPCTAQECVNVVAPYIVHLPLFYLLSGLLWEFKNRKQCQMFSSNSGRGHLRVMVAYKKFQI